VNENVARSILQFFKAKFFSLSVTNHIKLHFFRFKEGGGELLEVEKVFYLFKIKKMSKKCLRKFFMSLKNLNKFLNLKTIQNNLKSIQKISFLINYFDIHPNRLKSSKIQQVFINIKN
jgi:hypothetical protein